MTDGQMPPIASLTPDQEKVLHDVEGKLGDVYVIAYTEPLVPARLDEDQVDTLRDAEQKIPGAVLVAYKKRK